MTKDTKNNAGNAPEEVSFNDAAQEEQLRDLLDKKAKEKLDLENTPDLHLLKKSKFYYSANGELREQLANYKGYAIMIRQEKIKEEINDKETRMFPALVTLEDLRKMKKVNGNIVRKLQPNSLHEFEKMALVIKVITEIDKGI